MAGYVEDGSGFGATNTDFWQWMVDYLLEGMSTARVVLGLLGREEMMSMEDSELKEMVKKGEAVLERFGEIPW